MRRWPSTCAAAQTLRRRCRNLFWREWRLRCWCGVLGGFDEVGGVDAGVGEEPADDVGVVGAVVGHLRNGAGADVEVAREAGVAGEMRCVIQTS